MNEIKQSYYHDHKFKKIYKDSGNPDVWTHKVNPSNFTLEQFDLIIGRIRKDLILNARAHREPTPDIPDEYEASDNDDPDTAPYNSAAPIQSHTCTNPTSTNRRSTTIFNYNYTNPPDICPPAT